MMFVYSFQGIAMGMTMNQQKYNIFFMNLVHVVIGKEHVVIGKDSALSMPLLRKIYSNLTRS